MLTLGEVLALSRRSAGAFERMGMTDGLPEAVGAAALADDVPTASWVRMAVSDFARNAAADEWTRLMSRLRDSDDPARDCLKVMIERRLKTARAEGDR